MKLPLLQFLSILFLIAIFIFPAESLAGAQEGLVLWYRTLLPSLFPFTILSTLILKSSSKNHHNENTVVCGNRVTSKKLISKKGCFAILTGFLCGYPLGANIIAQMVRAKQISHKEGQYLLCFCNNASPAFIIQYTATQSLEKPEAAAALLCSVYGAALLNACLTYPFFRQYAQKTIPCESPFVQPAIKGTSESPAGEYTVGDAILDSFHAMIRLGGYLMLFSMTAKMVTASFRAVTTFHCFLIGVIEITNGVHMIAAGTSALETKLLLLAFCISFGGISCFVQSVGMCQKSGLSMPLYLLAKLINGACSLLIMYFLI